MRFQTFYFDVREVDWQSYTENYVVGTKKYILNEDPDNLEQARAHLKMFANNLLFSPNVLNNHINEF